MWVYFVWAWLIAAWLLGAAFLIFLLWCLSVRWFYRSIDAWHGVNHVRAMLKMYREHLRTKEGE